MKKLILFLAIIASMMVNVSAQNIYGYESSHMRAVHLDEDYSSFKNYFFIDLDRKIISFDDTRGSLSIYEIEYIKENEESDSCTFHLKSKNGENTSLTLVYASNFIHIGFNKGDKSYFFIVKEFTKEWIKNYLDI